MNQANPDLVSESVRAAPAASAASLILFGVSLSDWVLLASLVLIVLQVIFLIRDKVYTPWRLRNGRKR